MAGGACHQLSVFVKRGNCINLIEELLRMLKAAARGSVLRIGSLRMAPPHRVLALITCCPERRKKDEPGHPPF